MVMDLLGLFVLTNFFMIINYIEWGHRNRVNKVFRIFGF